MAGHENGEALHIPDAGKRLWAMFWRLSALRVERNRISQAEILAFLNLHQQPAATVDLRMIEAMDRAFVATLAEEVAFNEARRKASKGGSHA